MLGRALSFIENYHVNEQRLSEGKPIQRQKRKAKQKQFCDLSPQGTCVNGGWERGRETVAPFLSLWCHFNSDKSLPLNRPVSNITKDVSSKLYFSTDSLTRYTQKYLTSIRNVPKPQNSTNVKKFYKNF